MILNEQEAKERFESPLNLLNRLKAGLSPHNKNRSNIPSIPPTADQVVEDLEEKLKFAGLRTKAAGIMNDCLDQLKTRVPEIQKAEKLAAVAETMSKVVNAENKSKDRDESREPQFIVYSPTFIREEHFDTIYAKE